jgi:hypothetical protein
MTGRSAIANRVSIPLTECTEMLLIPEHIMCAMAALQDTGAQGLANASCVAQPSQAVNGERYMAYSLC